MIRPAHIFVRFDGGLGTADILERGAVGERCAAYDFIIYHEDDPELFEAVGDVLRGYHLVVGDRLSVSCRTEIVYAGYLFIHESVV